MTTTTAAEETGPPPAAPAQDTERAPSRLRWVGLGIVMGADIMDLLDATIVNVAGPGIRDALHGDSTSLQWFTAAYTLAFAMLLIVGARLGDILGRRRVFLGGVLAFAAMSALCGLARSPEGLIAFRALQGAAAALMVPQALGLIRDLFDEGDTAAAYAVFGPVMGLSAVLGPILGAVLMDADLFGLGWRAVFLINVPLGLAAFLAGARVLPRPAPRPPKERRPRLDLLGTVLVSAAMVSLIHPLVQGRESGWPVWTFVSMACAPLLLAVFGWHQTRRVRAGRDPLVEPGPFRGRAFTGGLAVGFMIFGSMMGLMLVLGAYLQIGLGWSATRAAVALIPWSLGSAVGAGLAGGVLGPRHGRRVIHGGLLLASAGLLGLCATLHFADGTVNVRELAPATAVVGFGFGLLMAPFFDIALAGVDDAGVGSASGVLNAVQQLAGALGVAVLGTLFFGRVESAGTHAAPGVFDDAMVLVAGICAAALAVAWLLAFLMPRRARGQGAGS